MASRHCFCEVQAGSFASFLHGNGQLFWEMGPGCEYGVLTQHPTPRSICMCLIIAHSGITWGYITYVTLHHVTYLHYFTLCLIVTSRSITLRFLTLHDFSTCCLTGRHITSRYRCWDGTNIRSTMEGRNEPIVLFLKRACDRVPWQKSKVRSKFTVENMLVRFITRAKSKQWDAVATAQKQT